MRSTRRTIRAQAYATDAHALQNPKSHSWGQKLKTTALPLTVSTDLGRTISCHPWLFIVLFLLIPSTIITIRIHSYLFLPLLPLLVRFLSFILFISLRAFKSGLLSECIPTNLPNYHALPESEPQAPGIQDYNLSTILEARIITIVITSSNSAVLILLRNIESLDIVSIYAI